MRSTVRPLPRKSQARPTRGSRSIDRVMRKPLGAFGSDDKTIPFPKSPVPGTKVPTRLVLVSNCAAVGLGRFLGSSARRFAVGQATLVNGIGVTVLPLTVT